MEIFGKVIHYMLINAKNTMEINIRTVKFGSLPQHPKCFVLQKLPDIWYLYA